MVSKTRQEADTEEKENATPKDAIMDDHSTKKAGTKSAPDPNIQSVTTQSMDSVIARDYQHKASSRNLKPDRSKEAFVTTKDGETVLAVDVDETYDAETGVNRASKTARMALKLKFCAACRKHVVKASWCSKCRQVQYCSHDCQRSAWPSHKRLCTPIMDGRKLHKSLQTRLQQDLDGFDEPVLSEEDCQKMVNELKGDTLQDQMTGLARFAELFQNHQGVLLSTDAGKARDAPRTSFLVSLGIVPLIVRLLGAKEFTVRSRSMLLLCRCTEPCIQMESGDLNPGAAIARAIVECGGMAQLTQILRCFRMSNSSAGSSNSNGTGTGFSDYPTELYAISAATVASIISVNKCQDAKVLRSTGALDMHDMLFDLNTLRPMLRLMFSILDMDMERDTLETETETETEMEWRQESR